MICEHPVQQKHLPLKFFIGDYSDFECFSKWFVWSVKEISSVFEVLGQSDFQGLSDESRKAYIKLTKLIKLIKAYKVWCCFFTLVPSLMTKEFYFFEICILSKA